MNAVLGQLDHRASLSKQLLLILIFSFTAADFLHNGIVAINAAPVMGEIGASPEEYSSVATIYAVVAITTIYKQRWIVERLGWRLFVQASMCLFAAGALTCAISSTLVEFALGRALMGLGGATFFTVGRVIVNHIPPSKARFTGIKYFANGLAVGGMLGPLIAAAAVLHGTWRYAFIALIVPALAIALISTFVLPNSATAAEKRSHTHPKALVILILGSFVLLHALQRSSYDWFVAPGWIEASVTVALLALVMFVLWELRNDQPSLRFRDLVQRRFIVGACAFTATYAIVAGDNYVLPILIRQALNLPLEIVGMFLAIGASAGFVVWQVMSRFVAGHPGPSRYFIAGFVCLGIFGFVLSRLSESADPWIHIAPALLLNGAFVMLVLATTAMQTFQKLQHDETVFSNANQVKNMLAQFGTAVGIAVATLVMQWRGTTRYAQLSESVTLGRPGVDDILSRLTAHFSSVGDPALAGKRALAVVNQLMTEQSLFMAATDYFLGIAVLASACISMVLLERTWRK
ncbi:MFS transporter [Variovorax sp. Varisp85]|uniref:MFS transporter n=1 Tax=Variovorax sp. Varisp85 TaxID=3243059 RepID=UPI0039A54271